MINASNIPVRIAGIRGEFRIRDLKKHECYPLDRDVQ
jgi:hypothetical protein